VLGTLPNGLNVSWPARPQISRHVSVSSLSDFNAAASVNGTSITVQAAIPDQGTINASDIEVQMTAGASLGGVLISKGVKRVALLGGQYTGTIELAYAANFWPTRVDDPAWLISDVMIDGVNVTSSSTAFFLRGNRIAVLRSYAHAADYSVFSDSIPGQQNDSVVLAGNDFESAGAQATVRLISVRDSVTVDNNLTDLMQTGSKHNYRIHGVSDQVYAARNMLVNSGTMMGTMDGDALSNIGFEQNTFHHKTPDLFNPDVNRVHQLDAHDNVAYTDVWNCFYCGNLPAGWSFGANVIHPYQP
jgi:hypothetical protein